jgi:hypothetical protein
VVPEQLLTQPYAIVDVSSWQSAVLPAHIVAQEPHVCGDERLVSQPSWAIEVQCA